MAADMMVDCLVGAVYAGFAGGSGALAVVDARSKRLPNRIMFPLYAGGAAGLTAASWLSGEWPRIIVAAGAMALLYGVFWLFWFFGPMGFGDVKLAGVLGLYLGWVGLQTVFAGLVLGMLAASVVGLVMIALRRATAKTEIAYGPYLIAGAWAALLVSVLLRR